MGYSQIAALQGRYLGTVRTTAAAGTPARGGVTEDSFGAATTQVGGKRFLWNLYNQITLNVGVIDTTNTWTQVGSTAFRQANSAAGNKIECVVGLAINPITVLAYGVVQGSVTCATGIGIDSTTVNSATFFGMVNDAVNGDGNPTARYRGFPSAGYHTFVWLEAGGGGTTNWYGDDNVTRVQAGMYGEVRG